MYHKIVKNFHMCIWITFFYFNAWIFMDRDTLILYYILNSKQTKSMVVNNAFLSAFVCISLRLVCVLVNDLESYFLCDPVCFFRNNIFSQKCQNNVCLCLKPFFCASCTIRLLRRIRQTYVMYVHGVGITCVVYNFPTFRWILEYKIKKRPNAGNMQYCHKTLIMFNLVNFELWSY